MPRNNRNRPQVDRRMPGASRLMQAISLRLYGPALAKEISSKRKRGPIGMEATPSDWKTIERNAYAPWGRGALGGRPTNKQPANRG